MARRNDISETIHILVYKNGVEFDTGLKVTLTRQQFKNYLMFLEFLTQKLSLNSGAVHNLFDLNGRTVRHFRELEDRERYVAATGKFSKCNYGSRAQPSWMKDTKVAATVPPALDSFESLEIYLEKNDYKPTLGDMWDDDGFDLKRGKTQFRAKPAPSYGKDRRNHSEPRSRGRHSAESDDRDRGDRSNRNANNQPGNHYETRRHEPKSNLSLPKINKKEVNKYDKPRPSADTPTRPSSALKGRTKTAGYSDYNRATDNDSRTSSVASDATRTHSEYSPNETRNQSEYSNRPETNKTMDRQYSDDSLPPSVSRQERPGSKDSQASSAASRSVAQHSVKSRNSDITSIRSYRNRRRPLAKPDSVASDVRSYGAGYKQPNVGRDSPSPEDRRNGHSRSPSPDDQSIADSRLSNPRQNEKPVTPSPRWANNLTSAVAELTKEVEMLRERGIALKKRYEASSVGSATTVKPPPSNRQRSRRSSK